MSGFTWPYPFSHMMEYSARIGELYSDKSSAKYKPTQSQKIKNKRKNNRRKKK